MSFLPEVKISAGSTTGVGLGSGNELGDYGGLDFYNNVLYPVWADDSNSTGDNPNGTANLDYYGAAVTLVPAPVPSLVITNVHSFGISTVVTLTWTNLGGLLVLENTGALPGGWSTVSSTRTTNANWVSTTVTNAAPAQFYRLKR